MTAVSEPVLHHYVESGLDYVWLAGGFVREETPYGAAVMVENASALDRALADVVLRHRRHLTGQEVRFLRGLVDLTQEDLGKLLGKDAQSVARWERSKTKIPPTEDRALRQIFFEYLGSQQRFTDTTRQVAAIERDVNTLTARETEGGSWSIALS